MLMLLCRYNYDDQHAHGYFLVGIILCVWILLFKCLYSSWLCFGLHRNSFLVSLWEFHPYLFKPSTFIRFYILDANQETEFGMWWHNRFNQEMSQYAQARMFTITSLFKCIFVVVFYCMLLIYCSHLLSQELGDGQAFRNCCYVEH